VAGGRQDILRLLAFGVIGVVGAAVLGVISLLLWKRD
jgi:putative flippase GtrA